MYQILSDRAVINIKGEDRYKFIQGIITNDIEQDNNLIYAHNLSAQGRFIFDMFIFRDNESLWLDVSLPHVDFIIKKLFFYKIRSKVEITDVSENFVILYSDEEIKGELSFKDPRYEKLKYRSLIRKSAVNSLKINDTDEMNIYLTDLYNYAIPEGFTDLISDKTLLPEFGYEHLNAISYSKGCYVGQEVISRAKYQGVIRKMIYHITFREEVDYLENRDVVVLENKIGSITSFYKNKAIALLKIDEVSKAKLPIILGKQEIINITPAQWHKGIS